MSGRCASASQSYEPTDGGGGRMEKHAEKSIGSTTSRQRLLLSSGASGLLPARLFRSQHTHSLSPQTQCSSCSSSWRRRRCRRFAPLASAGRPIPPPRCSRCPLPSTSSARATTTTTTTRCNGRQPEPTSPMLDAHQDLTCPAAAAAALPAATECVATAHCQQTGEQLSGSARGFDNYSGRNRRAHCGQKRARARK